jgi:hypothetical protein
VKCVRGNCEDKGTVLVHQIDTGTMQGTPPGPRTGDLYACHAHTRDIAREPGAWPWLNAQAEDTR